MYLFRRSAQLILGTLLLIFLASCSKDSRDSLLGPGPALPPPPSDSDGYFVNAAIGHDDSAGTKAAPFKTITWDDLVPKDWDPMAAFKGMDMNMLQDGDPRAMQMMKKLREVWDNAPTNPTLVGQPVRIPGSDEYKAPARFREALLEAMKRRAPAGYDEQVRRYYEELIR